MNNKYFITWDLEKTLSWWVQNSLNEKQIIDNSIRNKLIKIVNNSFDSKVVEFIKYDSIYSYFNELKNEDDFIIWLEDWIYIDNADLYFSSTRTYDSKEWIISLPKNYKITQRNWKLLELQTRKIISKIQESWKKDIIICDDWLFSWDTLLEVISDLQKLWIRVKEIRVILNFSWKDNINWVPINSMFRDKNCIDWLDERDLFYWTKNWGASFRYWDKVNWLPYISSQIVANKKASIPNKKTNIFCNDLLDLNKEVWSIFQETNSKIVKLQDLPRIEYLNEYYKYNLWILEILDLEINRIIL